MALDAGYQPLALLCEKKHIEGDAADIILRAGDIPVYTGSRELLASLTGYTLTRGVLCAMRRPAPRTPEEVCRDARRVAVIHGVVDTTNIGAIFRSAAALGIDAILLSPDSCDPLNRRAVRVSMGSVFLVPWTWLPRPVSSLREMGFCTASLALTDRSVPIDYPELVRVSMGSVFLVPWTWLPRPVSSLREMGFCTASLALTDRSVPIDYPELKEIPRLAIVMGTEGDGLPAEVLSESDYVVRIPMWHGVDSLNVAAASAVAFWELRARR